jgi:hypothetical protein
MKFRLLAQTALFAAMGAALVAVPSSVQAADKVASSPALKREAVNELYSQQWVTPNQEGNIVGSVVGLAGSDKQPVVGTHVFLVRDGLIELKTKAAEDGRFLLPAVEPGSYSLVVRDTSSIAAFSLHVLDNANGKHLTSDVEVRVVQPVAKVTEILREQTAPSYAARIDSSLDLTKDPLAASRSFAPNHVVKLDEAGRLSGRLGTADLDADMSDMLVYVLKDGVEVAKVGVTESGDYSVAGLKPGVYGLIAAGESGFAATSFELIDAKSEVNAKGEKLVGLFKHACRHVNVECVPCPAVSVCETPATAVVTETVAVVEEPCGEVVVESSKPAAAGCGCGFGWGGSHGGGGGGGGGFGGGGWAGLAGIAGLATVAGILAADDDEPSTASPIN